MRMDVPMPAACGACFQCRRTFEGRSASFNWCTLLLTHLYSYISLFFLLPMVRLLRREAMEATSSTSSPSSILSSTPWNTCGVGQSITFGSTPMGSSPLQRVWCQLLLTHVPWSPSDASFVIQNTISMSTHSGQQDLQLNMLSRNISHTRASHSGTLMQQRRSAWPKPLHFRGSPNYMFTYLFTCFAHAAFPHASVQS